MIHSILAGAVYVAMVLIPCVIARLSPVEETDNSDANVFEEGFI